MKLLFNKILSKVILPCIYLATSNSSFAEEKKALEGPVLNDPNITSNLIQTSLGLLIVLALIAVAAWSVKRFGSFHKAAQGQMKIVGGISLGSRERVVLLQVGDQQLVVGVAPGRIQTLHVMEEPIQFDDSSKDKPVKFSDKLQAALKARKNPSISPDMEN